MRPAARVRLVIACLAPSLLYGEIYDYDDLNIPHGWSANTQPDKRSPRTCNSAAEFICEQEYMSCQLYASPANDKPSRCACAGQFYGICLRKAGCAAERYTDCVDEHIGNDCDDMSVCGSNCVGNGNGLDLSAAKVLPVNNYGKNFLRFSTCDLGVDEGTYNSFELVRMRRCRDPGPGVPAGEAFKICPYWIPPSTFTALAIPQNSSYIRLEYANFLESGAVSGGGKEGNATRQAVGAITNVLKSPKAKEFYGTDQIWPSTIDVEFEDTNFCSSNLDCPGSYCNLRPVPHKCAPKTAKHFSNPGNGHMYRDHTFTDGRGGDTPLPTRGSLGTAGWSGVGTT